MRAYNEIYLDDAMNALGEAVDYAVNECNIPLEDFFDMFLMSPYADYFSRGNSKYVSGTTGIELVHMIVEHCKASFNLPPPEKKYTVTKEFWTGWILAYYQWHLGRNLGAILRDLSPHEILMRYPTLHEASEEKCADAFTQLIKSKKLPSRLQRQRKICGISQRELSESAGVNLRTLQQYETRTKDLAKASVTTVLNLATALHCTINDILDL